MAVFTSGLLVFILSPYLPRFLTLPEAESVEIKKLERLVTYGWGMIPVVARIGDTEWKTALWPKDGRYILPLNVALRKKERLEEGDSICALIEVG